VQCLCYLSFGSMPTLRSGMDTTAVTSAYVRSLQRLLTDLNLNPASHKTGIYDTETAGQIRQYQHDHALSPNGVVDTSTWEALVRQGCTHYTS
jgi:peptidoglycan hydrolase-like protein with peptidoglycan-binding domain